MDKLPSPGEVGLPAQFDKWRSGQEEAILLALNNTKRVTAMCAPTGSGKSITAASIALLSGEPTAIVTASKSLQTQYMDQFESIGMVDLRGRNNYKCHMRPDDPTYTCEQGYAARCAYKGTVACDCSKAEMQAATSSLVVTNYSKWCSSRRFGQGLEHIKRVIFDEGCQGYDALANAMQVILNAREIEDNLQVPFPSKHECDDFANWKVWASAVRPIAEAAMIAAQARIAGLSDPKPSWVKHFTHMRNLARRLATISTANAKNWVVEGTNDGYQFDPIRPGQYAEAALLLQVPHVTFIDATLRPKSLFMVGVGQDHFLFKEFDSDFNPKRCPIYYLPTMRVDSSHPNREMLWLKVDQILARRQDRKGLIPTTSYQMQKDVKTFSRFWHNMILNNQGEIASEVLAQYMEAPPPRTLVSPSFGVGQDFKDDAARYNIILKIPFEPPSKIQRAREEQDKEYRNYRAMQKIVQQLGRDVRSKWDWSERFILDEHWDWFGGRCAHLAPKSFHGFIKRVNVVPTAPRLEDM